ncbi:hypothetical protein VZT92_018698 [Zoarces viviparus]|uniref:Secreted protein n=1 Tax=Zoarces viviparus TaxID=48416 RepID=A0AAW1EJB2_ZOAVI
MFGCGGKKKKPRTLRLLTLAGRHSAARRLIPLLLPCQDGWWPGGGREVRFIELPGRPLTSPFVDCADPRVECYQLAAEKHPPTCRHPCHLSAPLPGVN